LADTTFEIRAAREGDRLPLAQLFAAVAEERDGIATEPPFDIEAGAARMTLEGTLAAVADGEIIGSLHVQASRFGFGEIGMLVARDWRGRGVGSALVAAAIEWARERGLHKLSLSVFPHNAAAIALYRKVGFVEEGRRVKHFRRASGELWDAIEMGLLLDDAINRDPGGVTEQTAARLRGHAGLAGGTAVSPAISDETGGGGPQLREAVVDFVNTLQALNMELNGPAPSETLGTAVDAVPRGVAYAVAESVRLLREAGATDEAWLAETAWLAVLAGDIDDVWRHLREEGATLNP
jgi:RimJ/RimL family protein N-acetyltransferase